MDSECEDPASVSERALRRQISEVGAVCSNPARTDLCGGRRVTGVPTATKDISEPSNDLDRNRNRSKTTQVRSSGDWDRFGYPLIVALHRLAMLFSASC